MQTACRLITLFLTAAAGLAAQNLQNVPAGIEAYHGFSTDYILENLESLIFSAVFLFIATAALIVAVISRGYRYFWGFILLSVNMSLFVFLRNPLALDLFFPEIEYNTYMHQIQVFIPVGILIFYLNFITGVHARLVRLILTIHLVIVLPLYVSAADVRYFEYFYMSVMLPESLFVIALSVYYSLHGSRDNQILLAGITIFAVTGVHDVLTGTGYLPGHSYWTIRGMMVLVFIMIYLLASKYRRNEQQLEEMVADRTEELSGTLKMIKRDIELAREIQTRLFYTHRNSLGPLDYSVVYLPVDRVGGDFYTIDRLKNGIVRVILGDATGHGIQAGFVTMIIDTLIDNNRHTDSPAALLEAINVYFCSRLLKAKVHCTAIVLDIDFNRQTITYSSAGHINQFISEGRDVKMLHHSGPMIGIDDQIQFRERVIQFTDSFKIFLYSDGLSEQMNPYSEDFTEERILAYFQELLSEDVEEITAAILNQFNDHRYKSEMTDDVTFFCLDYSQVRVKHRLPA